MITKIKESRKYQVIILVIIMLISISLSFVTSNPNNYKHTISILDEKRADALLLTTTSTAIAMGVTAIPTDTTNPVAELLTNISSYGILITCIIFLEKFLLTTFGLISFAFIFPASCLMFIIYLFVPKESLKTFAKKFIILGTVLFLIVPISAELVKSVEHTLDINYKETVIELKEVTEDTDFFERVKEKTDDFVGFVNEKVNRFIDVISVMLITTFFIPLGVAVFLFWIIKLLFNIEIKPSDTKMLINQINKATKKSLLGVYANKQ